MRPPPAAGTDETLHALRAQAEALEGERRFDAAAQAFVALARREPMPAPAWRRAADCLFRLDRHRDARACALSALGGGLPPEAEWIPLARQLRRLEESQALFALANAAAPHAGPDALLELASLVSASGEQRLASALVSRAISLAPADPRARYLSGVLCQFEGDSERAQGELGLCLHLAPAFAQAHWLRSSLAPREGGRETRVAQVEAALATTPAGGQAEAYLRFALHNELHALGRHDDAWCALQRGNAVRRAQVSYDARATEALLEAIAAACDASFATRVAKRPNDASDAPVPVFIVGMHRSGTTLLERILAGHPQVADGGETQLFAAQLSQATDHGISGALDAIALERLACAGDADFAAVGAGFVQASSWRMRGRRWFTEKQPANFLNVGLIARALPQARILHLVRDPVDTCFSNLRTYFGRAAPHAFDMRELAGYFNGYRTLMRHWHAVLPGRVLDVNYEALVADPGTVARRFFDFCGLAFDPAALDLARDGGSVATASHGQVRGAILRDRGGAWRPYAAHLAPLLEGLGR